MVKQLKEYYEEDIEKQLLLLFDGKHYYHHKGISVYEYLILGGEIYKVKEVLRWPPNFSNGVLSMLLWRMFITEHNYDPRVWLNFYRELPSKVGNVADPSAIYFQMITGSQLYKTPAFEQIEHRDPNNLHKVIIYMKESLEKVDLYAAYADLISTRPIFSALADIYDEDASSLMEAQKKYGMVTEEITFGYNNIVDVLLDYEKGGFFNPDGGYFGNDYNPKNPLAYTNQSTARWLGLNRNVYHLLRDSYQQLTLSVLSNKDLQDKWYYYDTYGDYMVAYGKPGVPVKLMSIKEITKETPNLNELQMLLSSEDNASNIYKSELDRVLSYSSSDTFHHSSYNTPKIISHGDNYIAGMEVPKNNNFTYLLAFILVAYLYIYFAMGLKEEGQVIIFDKQDAVKRANVQDLYLISLLDNDSVLNEWSKTVPILNENEQSIILTGTNISNLHDLVRSLKICIVYKGYYLHWVARKLLFVISKELNMTPESIIKDWMTGNTAVKLISDNKLYPFKSFDIDLEKIPLVI